VVCHTQEKISFLIATSQLVKIQIKIGGKNAKGWQARKKMGIIAYNGKANGQ
jgi:hypothetical protein